MTYIHTIINNIDPMTAVALSILGIVLIALKIKHENLKIKQLEESMRKDDQE